MDSPLEWQLTIQYTKYQKNNQGLSALKKPPITFESPTNLETDFVNLLDNFELTICIICGKEVKSYWEARYKGLRASCTHCEINWAES